MAQLLSKAYAFCDKMKRALRRFFLQILIYAHFFWMTYSKNFEEAIRKVLIKTLENFQFKIESKIEKALNAIVTTPFSQFKGYLM